MDALNLPFPVAPIEEADLALRASLLRRARRGSRRALRSLWIVYRCRLPLMEARIGWRP